MRDKEIKVKDLIITYSFGKQNGNCDMNGDFIEISKGEDEVSFLEELYSN